MPRVYFSKICLRLDMCTSSFGLFKNVCIGRREIFLANNVIDYDISRFTDFDISLLWMIVNFFFSFVRNMSKKDNNLKINWR